MELWSVSIDGLYHLKSNTIIHSLMNLLLYFIEAGGDKHLFSPLFKQIASALCDSWQVFFAKGEILFFPSFPEELVIIICFISLDYIFAQINQLHSRCDSFMGHCLLRLLLSTPQFNSSSSFARFNHNIMALFPGPPLLLLMMTAIP